MPHKPVQKSINPGVTTSVQIPINSQGVLYSKNRFRRLVPPGGGLPLGERFKGELILYLVDTAPHNASWAVSLPSNEVRDYFPVTINLKYKVLDGRKMVEDQVTDTEAMISRALEPILRKVTRRYALHQHAQVEAALEETITADLFVGYGLKLIERDVVMNLGDAELQRIKHLSDLDRAMRVPQQTEHQTELPTEEATYNFIANVIVSYKVVDPERLPTATLEEAEEWLWRRVRTSLRRVGRKFTVNQIFDAELAMQDALDDNDFSDHGLEIVAADIEIELDQSAREYAEQLEKFRLTSALEEEKAKAAEIQHQRELDKQERAIKFYSPYIEKGEWRLLALSLSNNELDAREVLNYLDEKQREKLELQIKLFGGLLEKDALAEDVAEDAARVILQELSSQIVTDGSPLLGKPENKMKLSSGEAEEPDDDEEDNENGKRHEEKPAKPISDVEDESDIEDEEE